ncbi:uncharacterized protein LOC128204216 [Mya arenaria]|uniref:uncharacterized protein LOC128204216 n=1 Tax=Mya arenaria TaxID=6604 RepID=UPI0022E5FF8C|nr:uncharacterized protein LOC128204216 [Mya arenaria]
MTCSRDWRVPVKTAVFLALAAVVSGVVAVSTPYWSDVVSEGNTTYSGLLVECNNTLAHCSGLPVILDRYTGTNMYYSQLWAVCLALVGWVTSLLALALLAFDVCRPKKSRALVCIFVAFGAGGSILSAVMVYALGLRSFTTASLRWSFGLDAASGVLMLISGVLALVGYIQES